jgi:hypothetical protein
MIFIAIHNISEKGESGRHPYFGVIAALFPKLD